MGHLQQKYATVIKHHEAQRDFFSLTELNIGF